MKWMGLELKKVILVTGTRKAKVSTGEGYEVLLKLMDHTKGFEKPEECLIVHGKARGVDSIADRWAEGKFETWPLPYQGKYGKLGGFVRNQKLVWIAAGAMASGIETVCLGFPNQASQKSGTHDCMERARIAGIPVIETPLYIPTNDPEQIRMF